MRVLAISALFGIGFLQPALVKDLVPDRRAAISRDVDYYGSDLEDIFDTTLQACRNACLSDRNCRAFTFDSRSGACFPKSAITDRKPHSGAISGQVFETDATVLARAGAQADDLSFLPDTDFDRAGRGQRGCRSCIRPTNVPQNSSFTPEARCNPVETRSTPCFLLVPSSV